MKIAVNTNYPEGKDYDRAAKWDSKTETQMAAIPAQITDYSKMCRRTRAALEKSLYAADFFLARWLDPFWGCKLGDILEVTEWAFNKGYIHNAVELKISITNSRTGKTDSASELFYCPRGYGLIESKIIGKLQNSKDQTKKDIEAAGDILSEYTIKRVTV